MKQKPQTPTITNRRARYDYELADELVVGLVLNGREVRAARDGHVQLRGAFVAIKSDELWLNNASFSLKLNEKGHTTERTIETNPRKLLATRRQIRQLAERKTKGMSIVPLRLLTTGRHIKLVIALGKGKKRYDKREAIKRREADREAAKQIKRSL